jgi:hypothetical protein
LYSIKRVDERTDNKVCSTRVSAFRVPVQQNVYKQ